MIDGQVQLPSDPTPRLRQIATLLQLYWKGETAALLAEWRRQDRPPLPPTELAIDCLSMAYEADPDLELLCAELADRRPLEAEAVRALHAVRLRDFDRAAAALQRVLVGLRHDPWVFLHF